MNAYKTHTDDTLRETVVHGNQAYPFAYYPENIWEFDFHRIDWHCLLTKVRPYVLPETIE